MSIGQTPLTWVTNSLVTMAFFKGSSFFDLGAISRS